MVFVNNNMKNATDRPERVYLSQFVTLSYVFFTDTMI